MRKTAKMGLFFVLAVGLLGTPNAFSADPHTHLKKSSISASTGLDFVLDDAPTQMVILLSQVKVTLDSGEGPVEVNVPFVEAPNAPSRPAGGGGNNVNPPRDFFFQTPNTTLLELIVQGVPVTPLGGVLIPNDALSRHRGGVFRLLVDICSLNTSLPSCGDLEVTWHLLGEGKIEYSARESRSVPGATGLVSLIKKIHTDHHFSEVSGIFAGQASQEHPPEDTRPEGGVWTETISHRMGE